MINGARHLVARHVFMRKRQVANFGVFARNHFIPNNAERRLGHFFHAHRSHVHAVMSVFSKIAIAMRAFDRPNFDLLHHMLQRVVLAPVSQMDVAFDVRARNFATNSAGIVDSSYNNM